MRARTRLTMLSAVGLMKCSIVVGPRAVLVINRVSILGILPPFWS